MHQDVFKAIADPTRREILNMLVTDRMNLNSVADHFDISRPAISRHIKLLTACGLIEVKQEGRQRICQANVAPLDEVESWIEPMKEKWKQRFDQLDQVLTELKTKTKTK